MSSFKTILLYCFCLATFLTANPIHRVKELDSVPAESFHLRLPDQPAGQSPPTISPPTRRNTPKPKPTAPLRPRSPLSTTRPGIRIAKFIQTVAVVPSVLAAAQLEDFYTIIALKIETGQHAAMVPARSMVCRLWDFELVFWSEGIDVPLSFVQAFAIDMAEWSSRHFSGFYDATVVGEGPLSGLVIFVQMRLKGQGGPLPYLE